MKKADHPVGSVLIAYEDRCIFLGPYDNVASTVPIMICQMYIGDIVTKVSETYTTMSDAAVNVTYVKDESRKFKLKMSCTQIITASGDIGWLQKSSNVELSILGFVVI